MTMLLKIVLLLVFFCCTLMTFIISAESAPTNTALTYDLAKAEWKERKCMFPDSSTYEFSKSPSGPFDDVHIPILDACYVVEMSKHASGLEHSKLQLCQQLFDISIYYCTTPNQQKFVETSLNKDEIHETTSDFERGSEDRNVCSYASNLPVNISQRFPYLANKTACQQICLGENTEGKSFEPVCELFVALMCKVTGKEKCDPPSTTGSGENYPSGERNPPRHSTQPPLNSNTGTNFAGRINNNGDNFSRHINPLPDDSHTPPDGTFEKHDEKINNRTTADPSKQTSPPPVDSHIPPDGTFEKHYGKTNNKTIDGPSKHKSPPPVDSHTPPDGTFETYNKTIDGPSTQTNPPPVDNHTPPDVTSEKHDEKTNNKTTDDPSKQTSSPPVDRNSPPDVTSEKHDEIEKTNNKTTDDPSKQTSSPSVDRNSPPDVTSEKHDEKANNKTTDDPSKQTSPPPVDSHTPPDGTFEKHDEMAKNKTADDLSEQPSYLSEPTQPHQNNNAGTNSKWSNINPGYIPSEERNSPRRINQISHNWDTEINIGGRNYNAGDDPDGDMNSWAQQVTSYTYWKADTSYDDSGSQKVLVKPYSSLNSSQPRKLSEPYYNDIDGIDYEQEKGEKKIYTDNKREHREPALKETSSYEMANLFSLFLVVIIVLVICGSFITYSKFYAKKKKVSKSIFSVMDPTQSKYNFKLKFNLHKPWKQPGYTKLKDTDGSLPLLV